MLLQKLKQFFLLTFRRSLRFSL